jgi:hypothetical protein
MKYIALCSFGKDSLASVLLALEHGEPLDEVLYCEVMFDEHTSGEVPEHRAFIYERAIPELKAAGAKITVIKSEKNFVDLFSTQIIRGKSVGKIRAWPLCGKCYVQRDCKSRQLERYKKSLGEITQYIGLARGEDDRIARLEGDNYVSILTKYGIDEDGARAICERHGLLSPIYEFAPRNGCFFCPNAKYKERRHLYEQHPDLWRRLLELQRLPDKATEKFDREFRFDEIDAIFRFEDLQISFDTIQGGKEIAIPCRRRTTTF